MSTVYEKFTAIADKIRYHVGVTDKLSLDDMPNAIDSVNHRGYETGRDDGYDAGLGDGIDVGYDLFWDEYQKNGDRTDYQHAFAGDGWTANTLKPKYSASVSNAMQMFYRCPAEVDVRNFDVLFNFSKSINFYGFARDSKILAFGEIITTYAGALDSSFYSCTKLHTIEKLQVKSSTSFSNTFKGCTALENITFAGVVGQNGLSVSDCPLTHDSLMSIINALETKTSGTWTATLGATNLAKLTDAEKAIATEKGWTLA